MGSDVFGQIQVVDKIASSKMKLIPDVYVGGGVGGVGAGEQSGLMSLALLQYLTGKSAMPSAPPAAPATTGTSP